MKSYIAWIALLVAITASTASAAIELKFTHNPGLPPAKEQERADAVSAYLVSYLTKLLGVEVTVTYVPVSNDQDAHSHLRDGTVDFGWFGGLNGVRAALWSGPGSTYLAQRPGDKQGTSVFIQGRGMNLSGIEGASDKVLAYGPQFSTSGHLMPAYFLEEAGVTPKSSSNFIGHDATIDAVAGGVADVGVVSAGQWNKRVKANTTLGVTVYHTTPSYMDYMWVARDKIASKWASNPPTSGLATAEAVLGGALVAARTDEPLGAAFLAAWSTTEMVPIEANEYDRIKETGCAAELIEAAYCTPVLSGSFSSMNGATASGIGMAACAFALAIALLV
eukprot:CAMPEP_0182876202 /NCGR_PEP_ID=MMETSP0034_2-20130328/14006_1 /TAXON_ID=156128 /ORGANISM="Nephroselmis pyriformis, Strain CCMP717" /LENGTH=333 /DNA_ID=CAMNT_0025008977 /DNA_START=132 /DNA_END=1133 /DNA_ORIENTATION=-